MKAMVCLAAAGLAMFLPVVAAHEESVHLTFEGSESGCPEGKSMCFTLTNGTMSDMRPGANVEVTFENKGGAQHMWMITTMDRMDSMHKGTGHHHSMAAIEDVPPGESGNASFTVPMDAKGLYIWCGEPGHEELGMWMLQDFDSDDAGTPVPWFLPLAAVAGAIVIARRNEGRR